MCLHDGPWWLRPFNQLFRCEDSSPLIIERVQHNLKICAKYLPFTWTHKSDAILNGETRYDTSLSHPCLWDFHSKTIYFGVAPMYGSHHTLIYWALCVVTFWSNGPWFSPHLSPCAAGRVSHRLRMGYSSWLGSFYIPKKGRNDGIHWD